MKPRDYTFLSETPDIEKPILVSGNPNIYKAYYRNMGQSTDQGKVVIDETSKTISIKYQSGYIYESIFSKIEHKNERDSWFGDVEKTIYIGKWKQDNADCSLEITKTKSNGCLIILNSRRIIDDDYGIDAWQKILNFTTDGSCF